MANNFDPAGPSETGTSDQRAETVPVEPRRERGGPRYPRAHLVKIEIAAPKR